MQSQKAGSGAVQVGGGYGSGAVQVGGQGSGSAQVGSGAVQVKQQKQVGSGAVQVGGKGSGSAQVGGSGSGAIKLPTDGAQQQQSGNVFTRGSQSVQAFFAQYGVRLP
jgi:hypothetical protein